MSEPGLPPFNLVEAVEASLRSVDGAGVLSVAPLRSPGEADLAVILGLGGDVGGVADTAAAALRAMPVVASVRRRRRRLLVRLADDALAAIGAELERGGEEALASRHLCAGKRYVVDFCDPNATKALHVGHLRNLAVGHALACTLEAGGAQVSRQSQIADAGHQIGEAMAGYLRHGNGGTPGSVGQKSDHFVGDCYASYAREVTIAPGTVLPSDLPVAREMIGDGGLAESLMRRWGEGDDEVLELWGRLRDWVVEGQAETLARLGIHFDRPILESTYFPRIPPLVRSGLDRGILSLADDGAVVYETGEEAYPTFPLSRADGFPNQNLRALVFYNALRSEMPDAIVLQVCGIEWRAHHRHIAEILRRLDANLPAQPTRTIFVEMVSGDAGALSSSEGNALLVDDLLDELNGREELRAIAMDDCHRCGVEDLAILAMLGSCLDRSTAKPMRVAPGVVLANPASAGLTFARAWARACQPGAGGKATPTPEDSAYRFAVLQSQFYRVHLARAMRSLDLLPLVRFLFHLSHWYLSASGNASLERAMRSLLGSGFRNLGLVRNSGFLD